MVGDKTKGKECDDSKDPAWDCPPIKNVTHPLRYYEFSPEEMKALEECDKESFYQRCLPFSTLFGTLTYLGVKNVIFSIIAECTENLVIYFSFDFHNIDIRLFETESTFGVFPKVMLAALVGHIYGRLSYIPDCERKLRRLPNNSYLGGVMRKHYTENNPPKNPKGR